MGHPWGCRGANLTGPWTRPFLCLDLPSSIEQKRCPGRYLIMVKKSKCSEVFFGLISRKPGANKTMHEQKCVQLQGETRDGASVGYSRTQVRRHLEIGDGNRRRLCQQ